MALGKDFQVFQYYASGCSHGRGQLIDITDHLLDEYLGGKAQFETPEEFDRFRIFCKSDSKSM